MCDADVVVDSRVTFRQGLGFRCTELAHLEVTLLEVDPREVAIRTYVAVVSAQNDPDICNRLIVLSRASQCLYQVVSNLDVAGVCSQVRLIKVGSFGAVTPFGECQSEVEQRLVVGGVQAQCGAVVLHG